MGIGGPDQTAFEFRGSWQEFAPIAFTNMLLNVVTLGFYRFWATTRERRYFWSKTRFIDDTLEWTGTGLELFFGFLIALLLFGLPFVILNLILQGLIFRGQEGIVAASVFLLYILLGYLAGVAIFRGQRYRLSRTYWHGIHGGSDDNGVKYGWSFLWKNFVAYICLALLFPWAMTSLWKERWEAMSFGPHRFASNPDWGSLMGRYVVAYLAPWVAIFGIIIFAAVAAAGTMAAGGPDPDSFEGFAIAIVAAMIGIYVIVPLFALVYYSAYVREVAAKTTLSTLSFEFTARTRDWIKLFLGNLGLYLLAGAIAAVPIGVFGLMNQFAELDAGEDAMMANPVAFITFFVVIMVAFGLVGPFVRYRTWSFYVRHMEAGGEVNLSSLTQSSTSELKQGEGLLDAFDMGAI